MKKKLLKGSMVALVVGATIWVFVAMRNQPDFSSPTGKRDGTQLEEYLRGEGNEWAYLESLGDHPAIEDLGEDDFGGVITRSFERTIDGRRFLLDPYEVDSLMEAAPGAEAKFPGGGRVWITGGALAFANASGLPDSKFIDWRNLDQTAMEKPPVKANWEWMFENPNRINRPQGLIGVRAAGFKDPPRWLSMHVFDARTNYHLGDARKQRPSGNVGFFGGEFKIWRRMPVIVVIDFAAGEWERQTMNFEVGEMVQFGGGTLSKGGSKVQLQAAIAGHSKSVKFPPRGGWDGRVDMVDMQPGGFRGIFSVIPSWRAPLIAVRNPNEEKNRIDWLESNRWMFAGFNDGDTPTRLEIIHAPKVFRAVFRLDEFPGLPASIVDVENLFETPLPAYRTTNRQQALRLVGSMVQMEVWGPGSHLPLEGSNSTAQQLLNRVRTDVPVHVNSEANEIHVIHRKAWVQWIRDRWPL